MPAFEDVPRYILDEWLERKFYTDEEQVLLKRRLVGLKLLKGKTSQPEEDDSSDENKAAA